MNSEQEHFVGGVRAIAGRSSFTAAPLPPCAALGTAETISWKGLPFFLVSELNLRPDEFGDFALRTYQLDEPADQVLGFLRDKRGDWEERFAIVGDDESILLWISVDGRAATWIAASASDKGTHLAIAFAERAELRS
jgi:hypothetical protein